MRGFALNEVHTVQHPSSFADALRACGKAPTRYDRRESFRTTVGSAFGIAIKNLISFGYVSRRTAFLYTKIINYTTNFVKYFWNKSIILFYTFLIYKNCIFFTKTYLINYNTMIKTVLVHYVNYKVIFLFSSTESKTIQLAPITEFLPITVSPPNIEALAYIVT